MVDAIDKELEKAELALKQAQQKVDLLKKEKESRTPDKSLAILIHDKTCIWNHTDGCSWYYEVLNGVHDWNRDAHNQYLRKARNILRKCEEINVDYEKTVDLLRVIYA